MVAIRSLITVPIAFIFGSFLLRFVLQGAPKNIAADLAQPLPVVTHWNDFGVIVWCCAFACTLVAAVAYAQWLRCAAAGALPERGATSLAVLASAGALLAALSFPVIFSSDVYAYAAYGSLAQHGIDPYARTHLALHDTLIQAAIWQWGNPLPACVYGPVFIWIAKTAVGVAGSLGAAAQLLSIRFLCSIALLACAPLLAALFEDRTRRRLAIGGVLLNPIAIWCAAEGHNDTIVLAAVLMGLLVLKRFGHFAGALALMMSALVKASGMAAAFALAIFAWPRRASFLQTVGGIVTGGVLVAMLSRPFEATLATGLVPHGRYLPQYSLQYLVARVATVLFGSHVHAIELAISVALVSAGWLAFRGARFAALGNVQGAGFLALALWLIIPNPYPWYALWILPAAFLAFDHRISWAIVAASITIFARYLPDMSSAAHIDRNVAVTLFVLAAPCLVAWWPFDKLRVTSEALAPRRARYGGAGPELVEGLLPSLSSEGTSADARKRTGLPIR